MMPRLTELEILIAYFYKDASPDGLFLAR